MGRKGFQLIVFGCLKLGHYQTPSRYLRSTYLLPFYEDISRTRILTLIFANFKQQGLAYFKDQHANHAFWTAVTKMASDDVTTLSQYIRVHKTEPCYVDRREEEQKKMAAKTFFVVRSAVRPTTWSSPTFLCMLRI